MVFLASCGAIRRIPAAGMGLSMSIGDGVLNVRGRVAVRKVVSSSQACFMSKIRGSARAASCFSTTSSSDPSSKLGKVASELEWNVRRNPQGKAYFVNAATGERSWDRPACPPNKILGGVDEIEQEFRLEDDIANPYRHRDDEGPVMKAAGKAWNALVQSQTAYWVAFGGAGAYLVYVFNQ